MKRNSSNSTSGELKEEPRKQFRRGGSNLNRSHYGSQLNNSDAKGLLGRLVKDFRSSLKPPETEEWINQYFNRPIAFFIAKAFQKIRFTPNSITVLSMVCGVLSGYFFSKLDTSSVVIAAILLEMMILLDCADGQLARMVGKSSSFGKTLDGLADFTTHLSIYYGLAYGLYLKEHHYYIFILAVVAQLSMYLHIILYDHYKNIFIDVIYPDYVDRLEKLDEIKDRIVRAENSGKKLQALISRLYYTFYKIENWAISLSYSPNIKNFYEIVPYPEELDEYTKSRFYNEMKLPVRLWSFIGDTIHLTIFVVFGFLNLVHLIFPVIILGTNGLMTLCIIIQRIRFKRLGLERELLWLGRIY